MKHKFRVLSYIPIFSFALLIIGAISFILSLSITDSNESRLVVFAAFFGIVVCPFSLFIWSFITMWPCVEFNDEGIEKTLLGFKQRFIKWDDIYEIRRISTGINEWLFFSKVELKGKSISYCRGRRDNIFISSTKEIEATIKKYAPSRLF